jgi:ribosomal protein L11 methylase PrmA
MSQNGVELAVEYLNSLGQLVTQKQGADRDYYDRLVRQSCDVVVRNITREIVDDLAKPLSSLCHRHVPG